MLVIANSTKAEVRLTSSLSGALIRTLRGLLSGLIDVLWALMSNLHGSINGSKYELARLKYLILVVSDVDAFIYVVSSDSETEIFELTSPDQSCKDTENSLADR